MSEKRLRVIIVGAGLSGILMACKFLDHLPREVNFHIFEKNADVGGTWLENRYPGCACDVPSHIYQFSFCPNPYWSRVYVSSSEIQSYLKAVVFKYKIDSHISFNSKIDQATWDEQRSVWMVSVEGKGTYECDVFINAGGILNAPAWPQIPGLEKFGGSLMHTAAWDRDANLEGKSIAIIGAGASAVQVLPALQPIIKKADIYIRTPSWITPPSGNVLKDERNHTYTAQEIEAFNNTEYSLRQRKHMEDHYNKMFRAFFKGSPEQQEMIKRFETKMREWVPDPELQEHLIPKFEVGCRRTSPGEAYLEALQKENVEPVFTDIERVTETGVVSDGQLRQVDVIIAATGFDTSFVSRFPIIGRDGVDLKELWKDCPVSYFGLAVSGFPNYLFFLGPNTPIANGSLIGPLEGTADYFIRLLRKMIRQKASSFEMREEVQEDFDKHTQNYMERMVWTGSCRSWFKRNEDGRVTALWPGSALHYLQTLESDRWEDYEWKYPENRFAYWGKGFSQIEIENADDLENADLSYYLKEAPNIPLHAYYAAAKGYNSVLDQDLDKFKVLAEKNPGKSDELHWLEAKILVAGGPESNGNQTNVDVSPINEVEAKPSG